VRSGSCQKAEGWRAAAIAAALLHDIRLTGRLLTTSPSGDWRTDNGLVVDVEPERFEEMVGAALDGLPPALGKLMSNVAVTVEHGPGPRGLLGLYEGIPLTSRTATSYAGVLPDRITIYRRAICAICRTEDEVGEQVRRTVTHEVAHHFGIDDARLKELGW
jgi:predicted Zn-dependent protease with MMP-like domain